MGTAVTSLIATGTTAQTPDKVRRIGFLSLDDSGMTLGERKRAWEPSPKFGWIERANLLVERRFARGKPEHLPIYADELVQPKVDVIVTIGTQATLAAKKRNTPRYSTSLRWNRYLSRFRKTVIWKSRSRRWLDATARR